MEPIASSQAVLTDDERELGVCLIDIGGGTTDMAVFIDGAIRHTAVIPIAGDQITNDIAVALRTPTQAADEIKKKYGCALTRGVSSNDLIETPSIGDRPAQQLTRQLLAEVIEPRVEELFSLAQAELRRSGFEDLISSGIVLTGGTSKMEGMVELAEEVFHAPVRLGMPQYIGGLSEVVRNPIYSTGVGLIQFGYNNRSSAGKEKPKSSSSFKSVWERMKNWFQGSF